MPTFREQVADLAFDTLNAGLMVLSDDGCVVAWNAWLVSASGIPASAAIGKRLDSLFPRSSLRRVERAAAEALQAGTSSLLTHSLHPALFPLRTKAGRELIHNVFVQPMATEPRASCLVQINDVTDAVHRERILRERQSQHTADLIRTRDDLHQLQKIQAIGHLTGGIAHDFNNLLTVIIGNTEVIVESAEDQTIKSLARMVQSAAERGADLNQRLLAYGRRQSLKPQFVDVSEAVSGSVPLLRRAVAEHLDLRLQLYEARLGAIVDPALLESALLNLILNARDAMPQGGVVTISTGKRMQMPREGHSLDGHPAVYVTVSDTGTGMSTEIMARAFEPFFTTKEIGKGSGLGLSMVFGFAEQSGGHVAITSKPDEGTSVTIYLPAAAQVASPRSRQDPELPVGETRMESILVVEDDPQVLQFITTQLLSLGYQVTAVSVGVDALERLEQDSRYDVLFTDVVLPNGLSGVEVARRAKEMRPDIRVLLTSGYPEDVFQQHGRLEQDALILRKPYRRKELADTLRKVLE
jgi:PAS domain S-box-containing protein